MASEIPWSQILDTQQQISKKLVALTVSAEDRVVTKALFLVGAYMILMLDMDEVKLAERFQGLIVPLAHRIRLGLARRQRDLAEVFSSRAIVQAIAAMA